MGGKTLEEANQTIGTKLCIWYNLTLAGRTAMEQQHLGNFLELRSGNAPLSRHALTLARSLITNPSTSNSTISTLYQTLTHPLSSNPIPNPNCISLHHILSLLSDLSLYHPHLRRLIFSTLRTFSLLPTNSPRLVVESLSILISISELDLELVELVEELSESVFLSGCFGGCVSVRRWLLMNAKRILVRPAVLVTVFLGFSKDPYPEIRKVALDGLSCCVGIEDRGMMEGCYLRGVEMLSDMEDCVRCSAVRVVSCLSVGLIFYWLIVYCIVWITGSFTVFSDRVRKKWMANLHLI